MATKVDQLLKQIGNERVQELEEQIKQFNREFDLREKERKQQEKKIADLEKENQKLYEHLTLAEDFLYSLDRVEEPARTFLEEVQLTSRAVTDIINNRKPRNNRRKTRKR